MQPPKTSEGDERDEEVIGHESFPSSRIEEAGVVRAPALK